MDPSNYPSVHPNFTVSHIIGIIFFLKIEKIEMFLPVPDDFVMPNNKKRKFSSTTHATLLSQINTHLLPEEKHEEKNEAKHEGYLDSLSKYLFSYLGSYLW
jgi:hypothetical protein